ncbi:hypothetical protein KVR01_011916 [Diaporthe batatas]|uniref:uncharacterized protein n=1 Tax=Diaporthe batatas TaxID=748121 RepID=UPI001D042301|nr:uncharacterized protein KVR01_011916 [Diaporthe batatas]KAG8158155.1 hypothetical protein KVR01_011916 [Diaporthe batatas]
MPAPKLIFGSGLFTKEHGYGSAQDCKPWLDVLLDNKAKGLINEIDTAAAYQQCEGYLGDLKFTSHFEIGTKVFGGAHPAQPATKDAVIAQAKDSLSKLGVQQIDILFIHCPDYRVSFEDTLSGIDALYKEGAFKRFGLANYRPEEVEEVIKVCKDKGFVLPSVFTGSYSAVARLPERELLPLLRKHKIAFYAYSPIAGGLLAKTSQQFRDQSFTGRWDKAGFLGKVYQFIYNKPNALEALDKWHEIAAAEGISPAEMAYRWVAHNSALDGSLGDGIIIGATSIEQWNSNLEAIQKGPLSAETAKKIDSLWGPGLESDSILDNWAAIQGVTAASKK